MNKSCSILIPNRYSWNGICLTIESILKRTTFPNYKIVVCDNSMAKNNRACEPHKVELLDGDDGSRLDYLREQSRKGNIRLIEILKQRKKYGHGENIKKLLEKCETDLAMLFVSSAEILRGDWLDIIISRIKMDRDLGLARFREGGNHFDRCWIAPAYWANVMLLNMRLYRDFQHKNDWNQGVIRLSRFKHPEIFEYLPAPANSEESPPRVFTDTGWKLYERLKYKNPNGLKMQSFPSGFLYEWMKLIGGIDRNSHRPHHPFVQQQLKEVEQRLDKLREQ